MQKKKVQVVAADSGWPSKFEDEKQLLHRALGATLINIQHIGSTSVPNLVAKPVIDILLEVTCLTELDNKVNELEKLGYIAKGENGIVGRRYFQKGGVNRTHQIHAFMPGSDHAENHLLFRDYLRANKEVAQQYGALKQAAAIKCNHDMQVYMALKHDFIEYHLSCARK